MLLWHKPECCCAFTWVDKWLDLFHALGLFFFQGPEEPVVVICSLCELSLYKDTNELVNSILLLIYVKVWDNEKRCSRQLSGNTAILHCKCYFFMLCMFYPLQRARLPPLMALLHFQCLDSFGKQKIFLKKNIFSWHYSKFTMRPFCIFQRHYINPLIKY